MVQQGLSYVTVTCTVSGVLLLYRPCWFMCCCLLALQGIFSEINLEGDAESELRQTEWLQSKQMGNSPFSPLYTCSCTCHIKGNIIFERVIVALSE